MHGLECSSSSSTKSCSRSLARSLARSLSAQHFPCLISLPDTSCVCHEITHTWNTARILIFLIFANLFSCVFPFWLFFLFLLSLSFFSSVPSFLIVKLFQSGFKRQNTIAIGIYELSLLPCRLGDNLTSPLAAATSIILCCYQSWILASHLPVAA